MKAAVLRLGLGLLALPTPVFSAVLTPESNRLGQQPLADFGADAGAGSGVFNCDLPPVVSPDGDGLPAADVLFGGRRALKRQADRLGAIVRVPTENYDDMADVDVDPRWAVFYDLHRVLRELFPAVHERMTVTKVNTFGIVYYLAGTDTDLRPLMLTAHQDVVPVPDPSAWTHPPFGGEFDGTWLWGRGALDDKNSLTAILSVLETLLSGDASDAAWTPRRGIVVALGFDEETSGARGAAEIATYLEATFGRDAMVLILDEGGSGLDLVKAVSGAGADDTLDTLYALPAVVEKGYLDIEYELHVRGGHSSVPLPHTAIGIAAAIVTMLEAHPYSPRLLPDSPIHRHLVCRARYSPAQDPRVTRLVRAGDLDGLAQLLADADPTMRYHLQTSQAVDIIRGGLKINAMPESVILGVNYRVAPHNTLAEVKQRTVDLLQPILDTYSIALNAFGENVMPAAHAADVDAAYDVNYDAHLILTAPQAVPASPISPTSGAVWDLFSGTIQHTFARPGQRVVPVGETMTGNTDVRRYLNLSAGVYRWEPVRASMINGVHSIDEGIHMETHMETVRFYYDLIRNFETSDL